MKQKILAKPMWLALFAGFLSCREQGQGMPGGEARIPVKAVKVERRDMQEYLLFNGVTQYQRRENIRSQVTGYISHMPFQVGDVIRKGQTFATVRTKEQDALREAAGIDSTLSRFAKPLSIRSNGTGIITTLNVLPNDYVSEGDVLATLIEPQSLVVRVNVPFELSDRIEPQMHCEITLPNGDLLVGRISGKLPSMNNLGQSQAFLISLPNANLPDGLLVQVRTISRKSEGVLSVPAAAIQSDELLSKFWVMQVVGDSLALRRAIQPGIRNDSLVQIGETALRAGDWVITEGSYQLQDSTLVEIHHP